MLFILYANVSSRLDENLPVRSQYYSDHRVIFLRIDIASPQHLDRSHFVFVLCFFTTVAMFTSDLNAGVVPHKSPPPHDLERLRTTMVNFIVLSIKLVFMILGVSYSRVLAQRPTGCCSAS